MPYMISSEAESPWNLSSLRDFDQIYHFDGPRGSVGLLEDLRLGLNLTRGRPTPLKHWPGKEFFNRRRRVRLEGLHSVYEGFGSGPVSRPLPALGMTI